MIDPYTLVDAETIDIDWFGVDTCGHIAQFSTGGGLMPPLPARNMKTANESLLGEASKLSRTRDFESITRGALGKDVDFDRYIRSFQVMASRGLYAFDIHSIDICVNYICVSAPRSRALNAAEFFHETASDFLTVCGCRFELGLIVTFSNEGGEFVASFTP